jgi:DNA-directed RNA polymerase sigma subunit (sigma70/sigma32)
MDKANIEKLISFDGDVIQMIRWSASKTKKRQSQLKQCGGINEVIQEVACDILRSLPKVKKAKCRWTTVVANHVGWTMARLSVRSGSKQIPIEEPFDLHCVNQDCECFDMVEKKELEDAFRTMFASGKLGRAERIAFSIYAYENTLADVGSVNRIGRERVRQLAMRGIRRMQQPEIAKTLEGHI